MNTNSSAVRSWIALIIAILSWIGVGFLLITLLRMQAERSDYLADTAAANIEQGQAAQLRVATRETEADRTTLANATGVDLLSAVNLIESVSASGTPVHVVSAQPMKANAKSSTLLNVVDLNLRAQGPFSSIVRVMQMLETLPLATTVQEYNLLRAPADASKGGKDISGDWSLNIKLRLYTTAALSS